MAYNQHPTLYKIPLPQTRLPNSEAVTFDDKNSSNSEIKRAKTVIFDAADGRIQDPTNWNPLASKRRMDHGFHQSVIEPLFILNYETGQIESWLGESMTANDALDEWTLTLREDIKWHDGENFDADDVLFTINMLQKHAPDLNGSTNIETWIKQTEKVDELTVKFTLTQANARFQLDVLTVKVWGYYHLYRNMFGPIKTRYLLKITTMTKVGRYLQGHINWIMPMKMKLFTFGMMVATTFTG
ncbi:ABC transporter substrate-binding protein [Anaerolineales bacterium HSG25]|nr:ABC transporter substrate-binding protein [Anaerolineales bacterium HSG25]